MRDDKPNPHMGELAAKIAPLLTMGGTWTVAKQSGHLANHASTYAELVNERGWSFDLACDRYSNGKVSVRGNWPSGPSGLSHYRPYKDAPSMGFSADRPPATIARDIERRFLAAFLPLIEQATEQKRRDEEADARAHDNANAIGEIIGQAPWMSHGSQSPLRIRTDYAGFEFARHSDHVKIEISTSDPERVRAVARLVAAWKEEGRKAEAES